MLLLSESRGEGSSFQAVLRLQSGSVLWTGLPETSMEQPKRLCQAIEHLETQKRLRVERGDCYVFASHLTPRQHVAVANLVGKKCKVSCVLNGVPIEALWCTGA